jgi:5-hydroxyisourate hydrolase
VSLVTTHVLDTTHGRPAAGLAVTFLALRDAAWVELARGATDADGRLKELSPPTLEPGIYRLVFETGAYWAALGIAAFHPRVTVEFDLRDPRRHHHVPLLVSPFGYTTYRGT